MATSSGYSQDPCRPGSARRRRFLRAAAVVALPVAGALVLSACGASGQDGEQMISLSNGSQGGSVTPVNSPTPDAVATVVGAPATQAQGATKHQKGAASATSGSTGSAGSRTTTGTTGGATTAQPATAAGWQTDFYDGFNGSSLNSKAWGTYNGKPSNNAVSTWSPSMVSVSGGALHLRSALVGGKWLTAGVSNANAGTWKYGKWTIRYKVQKAAGIAYVILLYPRAGWPPEYDLAEDGSGGDRSEAMSTLHWGSSNQQQHSYLKADFSQWVTLTETSTPGWTKIAINGKTQITIHNTAGVPSVPMWLGIQTQVNRSSSGAAYTNSSTPSSVGLDVDYVVHQKWVG